MTLRHHGMVLFVLLSLLTTSPAAERGSLPHWELPPLLSGDILFADSGDAVSGGGLFKISPQGDQSTVMAIGPQLSMAYDVVLAEDGQEIIVSAQGQIVSVHARTGEQRVIGRLKGEIGYALGMDLANNDRLYVANGVSIMEVDLRINRVRLVSTGGLLTMPIDVAVGQDGRLYVLDIGQPNQIVRIHPRNGSQSLVSRAGYLNGAAGIALADGAIFVTCVTDPFGNFGVGRVIRVEARTGHQRSLTEGVNLCRPMGIVATQPNLLLVADPYTPNPQDPDLYDGAIVGINRSTGQQEVLIRGSGSFVNPRGIAVVPAAPGLRKRPEAPVPTMIPVRTQADTE